MEFLRAIGGWTEQCATKSCPADSPA
jgi:hypothetical protein